MPKPERTITLDEALALLDKHAAADENKAATDKKKKVKTLLEDGFKQGRGGLGGHTRRLLDKIDSSGSSYTPPKDVGKAKSHGGATR